MSSEQPRDQVNQTRRSPISDVPPDIAVNASIETPGAGSESKKAKVQNQKRKGRKEVAVAGSVMMFLEILLIYAIGAAIAWQAVFR